MSAAPVSFAYPPRRSAGVVWLGATLAASAILVTELIALAVSTLAGARTVALMEAQMQADFAADAGVAVAQAMIAMGTPVAAFTGPCGAGSYSVTVARLGDGWRIVSEGVAPAPHGATLRRRVEALCSLSGRLSSWRYVRPLEPTPAGKT
ncbi:MAG: hypothetical protein H5T86_15040 [Armatimonadetes bacterium]|nr:hypothetical protein [Armatimonadota bacterium]